MFYVTLTNFTSNILVSRYTRESGVRTLERKIAALCRAVAVRVAENTYHSKREKLDSQYSDKNVKNDQLKDITHDASALAHPPEMPIVIDENALEDILGVRNLLIDVYEVKVFNLEMAKSVYTYFESGQILG